MHRFPRSSTVFLSAVRWNSTPPTTTSHQRVKGKVLNWVNTRGFGFIEEEKTKERYFVHQNEVPERAALVTGAVVEFFPDENNGKLRALKVSLPSTGLRGVIVGAVTAATGGSTVAEKPRRSGVSPHPSWNFLVDTANPNEMSSTIFTRPLSEAELAMMLQEELQESDYFDMSDLDVSPSRTTIDALLERVAKARQQASPTSTPSSK